ncbi:hypothetical protein NDU88_002491 [Pleurodeles waltl]|uniref:Uncharacterized protein n=1 Tax=Pleurodeles waltl TaxID=8319 RepID=A0AAV7NDV8_PLEWA|nr:hypothetical protein NDU88_002491 [Pleurodeles waltl]
MLCTVPSCVDLLHGPGTAHGVRGPRRCLPASLLGPSGWLHLSADFYCCGVVVPYWTLAWSAAKKMEKADQKQPKLTFDGEKK